jgi:hypothetical protein
MVESSLVTFILALKNPARLMAKKLDKDEAILKDDDGLHYWK